MQPRATQGQKRGKTRLNRLPFGAHGEKQAQMGKTAVLNARDTWDLYGVVE